MEKNKEMLFKIMKKISRNIKKIMLKKLKLLSLFFKFQTMSSKEYFIRNNMQMRIHSWCFQNNLMQIFNSYKDNSKYRKKTKTEITPLDRNHWIKNHEKFKKFIIRYVIKYIKWSKFCKFLNARSVLVAFHA